MANTENRTDYKDGFEISNHAFVNAINAGISKKIREVSGLELVPSGKQVNGKNITITLSGQVVLGGSEELNQVDTKIRQFMDSIRNPSNFISLIEQ